MSCDKKSVAFSKVSLLSTGGARWNWFPVYECESREKRGLNEEVERGFMADSFLSCDNMKIHPAKESKKEPQPMIVLSTEALATDDSYRFRRLKPPMPKLCCVLPVNAVAIFGVASTSILSVAIYVYCLIHLLQSEYGGPKVIGTLIATIVTSPDEFSAAMSKADNVAGASVADLVIFRSASLPFILGGDAAAAVRPLRLCPLRLAEREWEP
ncbi:unnamed protein product [Nippostrongylus brasiliensis]|uniref:Na_Ca_ex domain-containing protein n=1 Tax=Nippostrongylus brasiliensis TaxID=27835 RepID=A0A0N4XVI5_NIPBR|nr:unnamed protein product [Nippostrongylus brasiliensis]